MSIPLDEKIRLLIEYLDQHIAQCEHEEQRCSEPHQIASRALWEGNRTGFYIAKKAVRRILLDQKDEVQ